MAVLSQRGVIHVLANPRAGNGKAKAVEAEVLRELALRGWKPQLIAASSRDEALAKCRELVANGAERIIVVGGDGTVSIGVNAVAETETVLGIVATGSGNDLARGLSLNLKDVASAVSEALGTATKIDVIKRDGGEYGGTVAIWGFPTAINIAAEDMKLPKCLNFAKYGLAVLKELPGMRPREIKLTTDNETFDLRAVMVAAANTRYFGNNMKIAPEAKSDDGAFDVYVLLTPSRRQILDLLVRIYFGRHVGHSQVMTFRTGSLTIESTEEQIAADNAVRVDGEPFGKLPATLEIVPGGLNIAGAAPRH